MNTKRTNHLAVALMIAMGAFLLLQLYTLYRFTAMELTLMADPGAIIPRFHADHGGWTFQSMIEEYHIHNGLTLAAALNFTVVTVMTLVLLWSAANGRLLRGRSLRALNGIVSCLILAIPLEWLTQSWNSKIEQYETGVRQGKIVLGSTYRFIFEYETFLPLALALTFSVLIRQAFVLQADLEGTV